MADDVHTGRCLCGLVSYRTHGAPLWVAHCHCDSCRRHTGSPVATLDDPQSFVPTAHVFHAEHVPWFEIHDALPRFESGGSGVVGSWGPLKQ